MRQHIPREEGEPRLWSIELADSHVDAIRALADEGEVVDGINFRHAPLWAEVLIDSSARGWVVCTDRRKGLMGTADNLAALCDSLVAVGRKREREIAGRIKQRAQKQGAPAQDWAGEPPAPKPSTPRSIEDVARAWREGRAMKAGNVSTDGQSIYSWNLRIGRTRAGQKIAIDWRRKISHSTSRHVGAAMKIADRIETP